MFNNIGGKIKELARIISYIGIGVSIFIGIVFILEKETILQGIAIAVFGTLISWVGMFVLYAYGQLVENSDMILEIMDLKILKSTEDSYYQNGQNFHNQNEDNFLDEMDEDNSSYSSNIKVTKRFDKCDLCRKQSEVFVIKNQNVVPSKEKKICQTCYNKMR